jgi:hypothetical protein
VCAAAKVRRKYKYKYKYKTAYSATTAVLRRWLQGNQLRSIGAEILGLRSLYDLQVPAQWTCQPGTANATMVVATIAVHVCVPCSSGQFCPYSNGTVLACNAGTYSGSGAGACTLCSCPGGQGCGRSATGCSSCATGTEGNNGATCDPCRVGTYAPESGLAQCIRCAAPPGAYCPVGGGAMVGMFGGVILWWRKCAVNFVPGGQLLGKGLRCVHGMRLRRR